MHLVFRLFQALSVSIPGNLFSFLMHTGACCDRQQHPHVQTGPGQARGVSLHVPVEPRHGGRAGGHVLLQAPVRGSRHPLWRGRGARADHPAQLQHLHGVRFCQQHAGRRCGFLTHNKKYEHEQSTTRKLPEEGSNIFVCVSVFLPGRSALQKRVMALLRRIEHPTPGNIEVTFIVY